MSTLLFHQVLRAEGGCDLTLSENSQKESDRAVKTIGLILYLRRYVKQQLCCLFLLRVA